jgi:diadenylate cyclase
MIPSPLISTAETGTRHKAAERTAKQAETLAIAVSELKSDIAELKTNIKWTMAIGLLIAGILLKNTFI